MTDLRIFATAPRRGDATRPRPRAQMRRLEPSQGKGRWRPSTT